MGPVPPRLVASARPRGFTLIEMMIVVAIMGTLAALAGPSLVGLVRRNELAAQGRQLYSGFIEAQGVATASSRQARLVLRPNTSSPDAWEVQLAAEGGGWVRQLGRELPGHIRFGPASGVTAAFESPFQTAPNDSWCKGADVCSDAEVKLLFNEDGTLPAFAGIGSIMLTLADSDTSPVYALVFAGPTGSSRLVRVER